MTYLEIIMEASKVDVLRTHPVLDSSKIMSKFMTLKLVKTFGIYMNAFLAYKTWDNVLQQSCFTSALNGKKVEKQYLKCNEEMPSKNEQKGVSTRYMKLHVQRFDFFLCHPSWTQKVALVPLHRKNGEDYVNTIQKSFKLKTIV